MQDRVLSRPLEQFTPYTVTEPDRLRDIFRRIQRNGYNVALNDLEARRSDLLSVCGQSRSADNQGPI